MNLNVLSIPGFGCLNQNTIGQERESHEYSGHINQLVVYSKEKTKEELDIITGVIQAKSSFRFEKDHAYLVYNQNF